LLSHPDQGSGCWLPGQMVTGSICSARQGGIWTGRGAVTGMNSQERATRMAMVTKLRKGLASAAFPLALVFTLAGLGSAQAAQAAAMSHARTAVPSLHAGPRVALGSASGVFSDAF